MYLSNSTNISGIVIASLGVVADALAFGASSIIAHPVLKALVVILCASTFFFIAILIRKSSIKSRKSLLQRPPDLLPKPLSNGTRVKHD